MQLFCLLCMFPDVDPNKEYLISVFPVYNQQYGSRQSLPASLQYGGKYELR